MQDLITQMGARLLTSFNTSATHFIHQGKATPEVKKEIKMAKKHEIYTVSPQWLYKCQEKSMRVTEKGFPEIYDGKHLTLHSIPSSQPSSSATRSGPRGLSKPVSSPSLLTSASASHSGRMKRHPTVSSFSQMHGSESNSTQSFPRTAAAVTSSVVVKREPSSLTMANSFNNNSYDMSMTTTDQSSIRTTLPSASTSFPMVQEQQAPLFVEDNEIWQPLPKVPVIREERKRRRIELPEVETPSILTLPTTTEVTSERVDYFTKGSKYGPDAIYWDDPEGRQKKRALYQALGYTIPNCPDSNNIAETEMQQETRGTLQSSMSN